VVPVTLHFRSKALPRNPLGFLLWSQSPGSGPIRRKTKSAAPASRFFWISALV
jgi:hypothetical protein